MFAFGLKDAYHGKSYKEVFYKVIEVRGSHPTISCLRAPTA